MTHLSQSRMRSLKSVYGSELLKVVPKSILRLLAQIEIEIEKLKYTPQWFERRISMVREVLLGWGPPPKPQPIPPVPAFYRISKISHWYRDHLDRIESMIADTVCSDAVGYESDQSPDKVIAAFNGHIAPIAKLYGFELQMELVHGCLAMRGDISKASAVLTVLCRENRTPEIDWLLDMVTLTQL